MGITIQGWQIGIGRYGISADIAHIGKTNTSISLSVSSTANMQYVEIRESLGPLEGQFLANSDFFRVS